MNEITVTKEKTDYKQLATEYLRGMGMKLPTKWENQFIGVCNAYGLNPIKRECYAVGYGDNWNIITGYEVYIKRAERTGKLNGWKCDVEGTGKDMKAVLTIYRKDWENPFTHEVYFEEVVQKKKDGSVNSMWSKMPRFMTKKVCIAQGFRLCFADELGGMPYTSDELPEVEKNVTPKYEPKYEQETQQQQQEVIEEQTIVDVEFKVQEEDWYTKLNKMFKKYQSEFSQQAVDVICEALATRNNEEEAYNRAVAYLNKKGIKVCD